MFQEDGYQIIKGLLPGETCKSIAKSIGFLQQKGLLKYNDGQVEKAYSAYGVLITEKMLQSYCSTFSRVTQFSLCPTYSYLRIYLRDAVLDKHVDRPSCEISATIVIDVDSPQIWPIYLEADTNIIRIELEPGDALVYKGPEIPHWRERFDGLRQIQVFLHYIREDGPYKDFKFDERRTIGVFPIEGRQH